MDDGGLQRFKNRMRAIPKEVRKTVTPALLKSAEEIADTMRKLAPEDEGDLKDSIAVTGPLQTTPPYSQPGGSMTVPENQAVITVGNSEVRYPHLQEYGTSAHPAQPFFWPAFRISKKRAQNRIKRAISKAVKDTAK
ncbi:MAG: hypothetical protein CML03_08835 [Pseudooceanicola sp.]|mgnify:CR=1 FL=1|nr:hypothetical protein [Pseudooceanicola sp.]|tara:strand:+ start:115 stop:525 length:411 start_codon:yes stop_codon:yes gene_type:complete